MLNFLHIRFCELQKASGITPWKKCYSLLRWPCWFTDAQQTFTVQNKPAAVAPKETITHHFFVSGIGQKKTVDAAKICGGAENVVKTETQQTFVNGLLGFITLGIYTPLEARVCIAHNNTVMVAHRYGQLYLHCSLIYFVFFQLFLHSDQPLSEGEIIPFSGVCQSGEAALSTPEAVMASRTDWQTALMCNRRRPAATSSRRASFSALASANSFVYFASSAATSSPTHLHVSNCRVRQLQLSRHFCRAGLL